MRRVFGPDHRVTHHRLVGPVKTIFYHEGAKVESVCHVCDNAAFFEWDPEKAKQAVLPHIWIIHPPQPMPESKDVMPPPGR